MSGHDAPAFPTMRLDGLVEDGINIRDYFAARAMHAVLSKCGPMTGDSTCPKAMPMAREDAPDVDEVATYAYAQADAMLRARSA